MQLQKSVYYYMYKKVLNSTVQSSVSDFFILEQYFVSVKCIKNHFFYDQLRHQHYVK